MKSGFNRRFNRRNNTLEQNHCTVESEVEYNVEKEELHREESSGSNGRLSRRNCKREPGTFYTGGLIVILVWVEC